MFKSASRRMLGQLHLLRGSTSSSVIAICAFHCEGLGTLRLKVERAGGLTGVGLLLCSNLELQQSSC